MIPVAMLLAAAANAHLPPLSDAELLPPLAMIERLLPQMLARREWAEYHVCCRMDLHYSDRSDAIWVWTLWDWMRVARTSDKTYSTYSRRYALSRVHDMLGPYYGTCWWQESWTA